MKNNENNNFLSKNLRYLRKQNKKNLKDIGKVVNKTDVAVHYWEDGSREPNAVDLYKLSDYYSVNIDDLVKKDLKESKNATEISRHEFTKEVKELLEKADKTNLSNKEKETIKFFVDLICNEDDEK